MTMERLTIEDFIVPSNTRGFSNHRRVIRYREAAATYLSRKVEARLPQFNSAAVVDRNGEDNPERFNADAEPKRYSSADRAIENGSRAMAAFYPERLIPPR